MSYYKFNYKRNKNNRFRFSEIVHVGVFIEGTETDDGKRWFLDRLNGETITATTLDNLFDILWKEYKDRGYWMPLWKNIFERLDRHHPEVMQTWRQYE